MWGKKYVEQIFSHSVFMPHVRYLVSQFYFFVIFLFFMIWKCLSVWQMCFITNHLTTWTQIFPTKSGHCNSDKTLFDIILSKIKQSKQIQQSFPVLAAPVSVKHKLYMSFSIQLNSDKMTSWCQSATAVVGYVVKSVTFITNSRSSLLYFRSRFCT